MSTKHTPGPWHVEKRVGRYEIWPKGNGQAHSNVGIAQTEADANLIAAAPELLEACKAVIALLSEPVQHTGIRNGASCDVLRADCAMAANYLQTAIAKAEVQS